MSAVKMPNHNKKLKIQKERQYPQQMNMAVFCASALPAAVLRFAIGSPLDSLHITHAAIIKHF